MKVSRGSADKECRQKCLQQTSEASVTHRCYAQVKQKDELGYDGKFSNAKNTNCLGAKSGALGACGKIKNLYYALFVSMTS